MSAHYVITDIGMGIIPEAKSKYLRQTAAIAVKFKTCQQIPGTESVNQGWQELPANRQLS